MGATFGNLHSRMQRTAKERAAYLTYSAAHAENVLSVRNNDGFLESVLFRPHPDPFVKRKLFPRRQNRPRNALAGKFEIVFSCFVVSLYSVE